ncbi:larval cuticle protein LCP-17-like [Homarus americanus]|uniref:larval cuticle protein LCP-17-like n=1 Tax=Homarus americanus TaxID=6706 RepID=UPI001C43C6F9|nr:larval cuticle protein LCP-17-like [Homarus americanus]
MSLRYRDGKGRESVKGKSGLTKGVSSPGSVPRRPGGSPLYKLQGPSPGHQFETTNTTMKFMILAAVASLAVAAPQYTLPEPSYVAPAASSRAVSIDSVEVIPILRDDRVHEEDGRYSVDLETGNGIVMSQSGSPDGPEGAVVKAGQYSYTAPDGTLVEVKYVADENGFQPQSDVLPVAPAFPHPIPQFVLDQIAFAAEEDAARARAEVAEVRASASAPAPSRSYGQPQ